LEPGGICGEVEREHRHRCKIEDKTYSRRNDSENGSEDGGDPVVEVLVDVCSPVVATGSDCDVERVLNPFDAVVEPFRTARPDGLSERRYRRYEDKDKGDGSHESDEVDDSDRRASSPAITIRKPQDRGLQRKAEEEGHANKCDQTFGFANCPQYGHRDEDRRNGLPNESAVDRDAETLRLSGVVLTVLFDLTDGCVHRFPPNWLAS